MNNIFWDTNICIDFLTNREPWREYAAQIFDMAIDQKINLYCSVLSLATVSYYMEHHYTSEEIFEKIDDFISICTPATVDINIAKAALSSSFKDFEDAMQYYSALSENCDTIITRNKKDFAQSTIQALEPQEFLDMINTVLK